MLATVRSKEVGEPADATVCKNWAWSLKQMLGRSNGLESGISAVTPAYYRRVWLLRNCHIVGRPEQDAPDEPEGEL